jgi:hypothetical protein
VPFSVSFSGVFPAVSWQIPRPFFPADDHYLALLNDLKQQDPGGSGESGYGGQP